MKKINAEQLKQVIDSQTDMQLIDVRTPSEYLSVRIANSQLMPLSHFDQFVPMLNKQKEVYVLCRSGRRSEEFGIKISALGFNPVLIEGGIEEWIKKQYPVERTKNVIWSLERQTRFAAGLIVFLAVLLGMLFHSAFLYVAGFVGVGLMFAGATDFCGMGIMLSKMPWNKKMANLA